MNPQNQTLLAAMVALVISTAFLGVYGVSYQYDLTESAESIEVWSTDSNIEFSEMDTTDTYPALINVLPYGIGSYMRDNTGVYHKNNCTPVYSGNDTWQASMIGFTATSPIYQSAYYLIPIDIPEAKTFIADKISINITFPVEPIIFSFLIGGYNEPQTILTPTGVTLSNQVPYSTGLYGGVYELTSYQKLTWYNAAKNTDTPSMTIYISDPPALRDGLSSFALAFNVSIEGRTITTWSLQDSVNVVLGGSIALNIIVAVYMSDAVDFGGVSRKDLHRGGGERSKRRR